MRAFLLGISRKAVLAAVAATALFVLAGNVLADSGSTAAAPTIAAQQAFYSAGDQVALSGSGWSAGDSVQIAVTSTAGDGWQFSDQVVADSAGNVVTEFAAPSGAATYLVQATGASGDSASSSFGVSALIVSAPSDSSSSDGSSAPADSSSAASADAASADGSSAPSDGSPAPADSVSVDPALGPQIWTDLNDYAPGSTVTLSGSGWQAGTVHFTVDDNSGATWSFAADVEANADGSFTTSFDLPNWVVATYLVIANEGSESADAALTAQWAFTDSAGSSISTTTALSASSTSITYGSADTFTATVTASPNPGTGDGTVTFKDGATVICNAVVLSGNSAQCVAAALSAVASPHSITASYSGTSGSTKYLASNSSAVSVTVAKKSVSGSFTAANKEYDKTNAATILTRSLLGAITGDDVSLSGGTATFAQVTVADGIAVSGTGLTLAGAAAGNYTLSNPNESTTANITPKAITGTYGVSDKVYDGNTKANIDQNSVVLTGVIAGDQVNVSNGSAYFDDKNVGTHKIVIWSGFNLGGQDQKQYYLASTSLTSFGSITAAPLTGSFTAADKTYDGSNSATISGRALTGAVKGDDISLSGGSATFSDANVGHNKTVTGNGFALSGVDGGNYTLSNPNGETTVASITQASSSVTVVCSPTSLVYDGTAKTPCSATYSGAGGLSGSLTPSYSANVDAGTVTAFAAYAGDANHTSSSGSATFQITKASSSVTVTCSPSSVAYTGSAQTPCSASYSGVGGLSGSLAPTYSANVNVGTVTASASYGGDLDHNGSTGSATFQITKASSSIQLSCSDVTYNGNAQTPCTATPQGAGTVTGSASISYSNNTNAGNGSATASYGGDANHNAAADVTKSFAIAKAASSVSLACSDMTYNGNAQTPCNASASGVGGVTGSASIVYSGNTNAGTGSATAKYAGDANHNAAADVTKTFAIGKADSSVSVSCSPASVVYNGAAQTPCSASYSGIGGLSGPLTPSYSANIDAGQASAFAAYVGDANHNGSNGSANFQITKADSSVSLDCSDVTYNGNAQTPCHASPQGDGIVTGAASISYSDNTNAGNGNATASYGGDSNHNAAADVSKSFAIGKANSSLSLDCSDVTYNGAAQEPCSASPSGIGGVDGDASILYSDSINAGDGHATASYGGDSNHNAADDVSKSFAIGKANSSLSLECSDVSYNGAAQEPCSASPSGIGGVDGDASILYSDNINAGDGHATASYGGDSNHNAADDVSKSFAIGKADATIELASYVGTYDGDPHSASGSAKGVKGESLGDISFPSHTDAGSYTDDWSFSGGNNYNDANGSVTSQIDKADARFTVDPYSEDYNGLAHTASGSATGAKGESLAGLDFSGTSHKNAGDYPSDSWTFTDVTGNYNDSSGTINDSIAAIDATIQIDPYSVVYDSNSHSASGTASGVEGDGDLSGLLDFSGTAHSDAGTYSSDHWSFHDPSGNYKDAGDTITDQIDKAPATISISGLAKIYSGDPQFASASVDPAVTGLSVSYAQDGNPVASPTNAGSYDVSASLDNPNYAADPASAVLHIAKADAVIAVTGYSKVYDGTEQQASGTATGVQSESLDGLDLSGTKHTNAGDYTGLNADSWTFTDVTGNYKDQSGTVDDAIAKAKQAISFAQPGPLTFGDPDLTLGGISNRVSVSNAIPPVVTVLGLSGLDVSYASSTPLVCTIVDGKLHIVASGSCIVTASQAGDQNYTVAGPISLTLAVDKAKPASTVVVAPASQQYSDKVSITVTMSAAANGALPASAQATLSIGPGQTPLGSVSLTPQDGKLVGSATLPLIYPGNDNRNSTDLQPGAKNVTATFTAIPNFDLQAQAGSGLVAVTPEDANVAFTGAASQATGTVALAATVSEPSDGSAGDLRRSLVSFVNRANGQILCSAAPDASGNAACSASLPNADTYSIGMTVGGYYTGGTTPDNGDATLNVFIPASGGHIDGGGWLANQLGVFGATIGLRTDYGIDVHYKADKKTLEGHVDITVRNNGRIYKVKTTTLTSLAVKDTSAKGVSSGQATYIGNVSITDVTKGSVLVGNGTLKLTMTDTGNSKTDTLGIAIWYPGTTLWYSTLGLVSGLSVEQIVGSGDLHVRSK